MVRKFGALLALVLVASVLTGVTSSSAAAAPTIYGPALARLSSTVNISGRVQPGQTVQIFFHKKGQPANSYVLRRSLKADAGGVYRTSYAATTDYRYYARAGATKSRIILTQASYLSITGKAQANKSTRVVISGRALPAGTVVRVYFHRKGQPAGYYSWRRSIRSSAAGTWSTSYMQDTDYRYYARAAGWASGVVLTQTVIPRTTAPRPTTFPNSSNTGVPNGTALTAYAGPCTITQANVVIDRKTINCDLNIRAAGVKVTRSLINGVIATDDNSNGYSFTISDSTVNAGNAENTGIGAAHFVATRVHVYGGNRSIHCYRSCTVQDSYVHGQFTDASGVAHESGIRMGQSATIRHNTIGCDAPNVPPDAGCSAGLTGYGDFDVVQNNLVEDNLFLPSTGGFCAYGGSSPGKPYSGTTNHIIFRNNTFRRGSGGNCGYWGAITDFDSNAPGNVWVGNVWDSGAAVRASN